MLSKPTYPLRLVDIQLALRCGPTRDSPNDTRKWCLTSIVKAIRGPTDSGPWECLRGVLISGLQVPKPGIKRLITVYPKIFVDPHEFGSPS